MLVRLTLGTLVGIPLGVALLLAVPAPLMSAALGAVLVGYAAYALLPTPPVRVVHPRWAYPTGLLAGALGSAYNFNGVPVVVFGTLRRWRPAVFRQTLQAHFLVSGALVVTGQALGGLWTDDLPRLYALCLPALVVATVAGHRLHRRIPGDAVRPLRLPAGPRAGVRAGRARPDGRLSPSTLPGPGNPGPGSSPGPDLARDLRRGGQCWHGHS